MDKFDLMKYTDNYNGVDSAVPEPWVEKLMALGLDRHSILLYYAYSYKNSSFGKPVHLAEAMLEKMANIIVKVTDGQGKPIHHRMPNGDMAEGTSLLYLDQSIFDHPDELEIRVR